MKAYCVSRSFPGNIIDPSVELLYLGPSLDDALNNVPESFKRFETSFSEVRNKIDIRRYFSILGDKVKWEIVKFYKIDYLWCSIVEFDISDWAAFWNKLQEAEKSNG